MCSWGRVRDRQVYNCRKNSKSIFLWHVLNGEYPEKVVKRMCLLCLERLVTKLVQSTNQNGSTNCNVSKSAGESRKKPIWWPCSVRFNDPYHKKGLKGHNNSPSRELDRLTAQKLIRNCSRFYKTYWDRWATCIRNDENFNALNITQTCLPEAEIDKYDTEKIVLELDKDDIQDPITNITTITSSSLTQTEFLSNLKLEVKKTKVLKKERALLPSNSYHTRFSQAFHIPFSSDVGRKMAKRENHEIPEVMKLRRLEKNEWYINRKGPKGTVVVDNQVEGAGTPVGTSSYKEPVYCHRYRMPKRQHHQKQPTFRDPDFLSKFCRPVSVQLERIDLAKIPKVPNNTANDKRLVVLLKNHRIFNCNTSRKSIARTSPRPNVRDL